MLNKSCSGGHLGNMTGTINVAFVDGHLRNIPTIYISNGLVLLEK
jgi:prepilin-type processing-associated H-X9-DG protein